MTDQTDRADTLPSGCLRPIISSNKISRQSVASVTAEQAAALEHRREMVYR
ncbi:hypothetical protein FACS1894186_2930 [Alphaproteobacteria bacterium]|nr:hypothetical protein FACS1894186_2930 [Alphaproteobacteria bacterium]